METERNACGYCRQPMVTTVPYQLCAVHVVEYYRGLLDARQAQALGSAVDALEALRDVGVRYSPRGLPAYDPMIIAPDRGAPLTSTVCPDCGEDKRRTSVRCARCAGWAKRAAVQRPLCRHESCPRFVSRRGGQCRPCSEIARRARKDAIR